MENRGRRSASAFRVDFSESQTGITLTSGIICKIVFLLEHPGSTPICKKVVNVDQLTEISNFTHQALMPYLLSSKELCVGPRQHHYDEISAIFYFERTPEAFIHIVQGKSANFLQSPSPDDLNSRILMVSIRIISGLS
jgi:hypothetical protein